MRKIGLSLLVFIFLFSSMASAQEVEKRVEKKVESSVLFESLGYDLSKKDLFSSSNIVVTNNNLAINGKEVERYAELGYSLEQIKDFDKTTVEHLSGLEGELLAVDKAYMREVSGEMQKISKSDYEAEVNEYLRLAAVCSTSSSKCSDFEVSSNWMELTTSISRIANTSPQEYIIIHNFKWTKKPFYTYKDAVGVAHPSSMTPIQDSEYLQYTSDEYISTNPIIGLGPWTFNTTKNSYYWSANDKTGGMAYEFSLHKDYTYAPQIGTPKSYEYRNHRGTLAYRAIRGNSSQTSATISGHYIHTESSYSGSLGVAVDGVSLSISANVTKTPAIETGVSFYY